MAETISFKDKSFTLKGEFLKKGDKMPDCILVNNDLEEVKLSSYDGKALLIMTLPSLDTSVCSKEAHRFNQELGRFGKDLVALAISMDLPFAQTRWCAAEEVDHLITLSDYKHRVFGEKFGVLIPELGLLARSIFIFDHEGTTIYSQLVKEISNEPDYEQVIQELTLRVG